MRSRRTWVHDRRLHGSALDVEVVTGIGEGWPRRCDAVAGVTGTRERMTSLDTTVVVVGVSGPEEGLSCRGATIVVLRSQGGIWSRRLGGEGLT